MPFIILGAGGHGKVLADCLKNLGHTIVGFTDPEESLHGTNIEDVPVLGPDVVIQNYSPMEVYLANGIGSTGSTIKRKSVYQKFDSMGYRFVSLIHPRSIMAGSVILNAGIQIMAGAIIQPGTTIDENSIVNTGAIIDHDCVIGKHVHIGPGVVISGGVSVEEGSHVGAGACILQGLIIGANAVVGAGAVVTRNVLPGSKVAGIPAKPMVHA